mmetsp:Transcript_43639/g.115422  ORF Transcript_43639/g.115422 Transcript_43639/m.115422 type:complete len:205 (-) Transcript_43639:224-838(-)
MASAKSMTRTQKLGKQPFPELLGQDVVQLVRVAQAARGAAGGRAHQREEAEERKAAYWSPSGPSRAHRCRLTRAADSGRMYGTRQAGPLPASGGRPAWRRVYSLFTRPVGSPGGVVGANHGSLLPHPRLLGLVLLEVLVARRLFSAEAAFILRAVLHGRVGGIAYKVATRPVTHVINHVPRVADELRGGPAKLTTAWAPVLVAD